MFGQMFFSERLQLFAVHNDLLLGCILRVDEAGVRLEGVVTSVFGPIDEGIVLFTSDEAA